MKHYTKKSISLFLVFSMLLSLLVTGVSAAPSGEHTEDEYKDYGIVNDIAYELSLTDAERAAIHAEVDKLNTWDGKDVPSVADLKAADKNSLVGALLTGASYNSISYGSRNAGSIPTEYPFYVPDVETNAFEHTRKVAKYDWVVQLIEALGLEAVRYQNDKTIYVEIGDPDAPEMVMALSHLDSPTGANNGGKPGGNLDRWTNYNGEFDPDAYYNPYLRDGWVYGTGLQDDSGPTLATLFALAAIKNSGVALDRRIRVAMGCYEDSSPGIPSVESTLGYMDIPYLTSTSIGFYDNWAYKYLNREETPIAAYTSDSRFPVIIGNTRNMTGVRANYDLSADAGKDFSLVNLGGQVTKRAGDETLKDIVHGSAAQIASRGVFELNVTNVSEADRTSVVNAIKAAAEKKDWTFAVSDRAPESTDATVPNVTVYYTTDAEANTTSLVLDINTNVAMEYPTPHYGKNGVVWGMYLLSEALPNGLELKKAAKGLSDMFIAEREAYIGKGLVSDSLLRNSDDGAPNLTIAIGYISSTYALQSYLTEEGNLSLQMGVRQMFTTEDDYNTAREELIAAFEGRGYELTGLSKYSSPTLYLSRDNALTALQFASYKASMLSNPAEFEDVFGLLDISSPIGTTGGTLATNYRNKMTAFGAIIPGNERWWHSANERITVTSIVQMTKMMADGMVEMARYSNNVGARFLWADIENYNPNRADLDLLDVTVDTYKDASATVQSALGKGESLVGATSFEIPMWKDRGNTSFTAAAYAAATHGTTANDIYLDTENEEYLSNTAVLPMRLEFRYDRPEGMSDKNWDILVNGDASNFNFYILVDGGPVALTVPAGQDASKYFTVRAAENEDNVLYVTANLAILDGVAYNGVKAVLADSSEDLYKLNADFEKANGNPWPNRGQSEERGFFLFGDNEKDAEFHSPMLSMLLPMGPTTIENAILYQVNDQGKLEYNVTYSAAVASDVKVSGGGVSSLDELVKAMGKADAPEVVLGADVGKRTLSNIAYTANLSLVGNTVTEIRIVDKDVRPVVGISWKSDKIGSDYQGFAEAYERNGAYAVYLPQLETAEEALEVLNKIDGVFVTGGSDWGTDLYTPPEEAYPHGTSGVKALRDTSDLNLMRQAIELDVPMFMVCRGEQGFNIAMGGGLIQDIPTYLAAKVLNGDIAVDRVTTVANGKLPEKLSADATGPYAAQYEELYAKLPDSVKADAGDEDHPDTPHLRVWIDGNRHSGGSYHPLESGVDNQAFTIKEGSKVYKILTEGGIDISNGLPHVATAHHQAVNPEALAPSVEVTAMSSEGIIEAIEHKTATYAVALQWHPEHDALGDSSTAVRAGVDVDQDSCNVFLRALVNAAIDKRDGTSSGGSGGGSSSGGSSRPSGGGSSGGTTTPVNPNKPDDTQTPSATGFSDVASDAYYTNAVKWAVENNITSGTTETTFSPDNTCTRAQIMTFLWAANGRPEVENAASFGDVAADSYYAKAVAWAVANGITSGTGDGLFGSENTCTRAQAMTFLWVAAGRPEVENAATFADVPADAYYAKAVSWAVANGITAGVGDGLFGSDNTCTRAQIVTFLFTAQSK